MRGWGAGSEGVAGTLFEGGARGQGASAAAAAPLTTEPVWERGGNSRWPRVTLVRFLTQGEGKPQRDAVLATWPVWPARARHPLKPAHTSGRADSLSAPPRPESEDSDLVETLKLFTGLSMNERYGG